MIQFELKVSRRSWGHRRNMKLEDVLSMEELVETLVSTVRWLVTSSSLPSTPAVGGTC